MLNCSTKSMSRYRSPEIIGMMNELAQGKERLAIECDNAYAQFLERISQKYSEFRDVVQSVATLDCLLSLATVAARPGYCKPTFVDEVCIDIVNGRHPMVEQMLLDSFVPNDIIMDGNGLRTMVITGPNMGGKSSFVRQTALIQIMGQIGSYVPAETATLGIVDALFTRYLVNSLLLILRMGAFDNMLSGESTFMVELHETADIIKQATPRSLVILDELGRGTSTMDGAAIAHAVLTYFITTIKSLMLFITHYPSLGQFADQYPTEVGNFHMSFLERVNEDESHEITFLHKLVAGQSQGSYGLNVAKLAGLPSKLIQEAAFRSKELEQTFEKRQQTFVAHVIGKYFKGTENIDVEMLYRLFQSGSHINPAN